jgi:hypothetical protein
MDGIGMRMPGMGMGMAGSKGMPMEGAGMYPPNVGYASNNREMYSNYGAGLFNQNPTFSMTGHTYFHRNQGNPNRITQEVVNY